MAHDSRFWDRIAARYFAKPIKDTEAYEEKLRLTQEHLHPDMEMLEFGCGTGGTAIRHAPHVRHIHAVDISDAMLDIARREADAAGLGNVRFERSDIAGFDAASSTYDAVLGLSILHLVEDPGEVIRNVHRWLKPGGIFVSSTACLGDTMGWFRHVGPIGRALGLIPYVNVFSADTLLSAMTGAGFSVDTQIKTGGGATLFLICKKDA